MAERKTSKKPSDTAVEDALAALIASTKRVRRKLTLVQVADKLEVAIGGLGTIEAVADRVGLSPEMLRQFRTIRKLCPQVKRLVEERQLESVDIAHRLTKLPARDQIQVAQAVARGDLTSNDARAIIALKRDVPRLPIQKVIERVRDTRAIKRYLLLFAWPTGRITVKKLQDRFLDLLGQDGVVDLRQVHGLGVLMISKIGKDRLQSLANKARITKKALLDRVLAGETK